MHWGNSSSSAGPGDYYVIAENLPDPPKFKITDEDEFRLDLRVKRVITGTIKGRVVMHDNRDQGVAEVKVFGYPEESGGRHLRATTDKEGRFEDRRQSSAQIVGAFSEDGSLGTVVRIEPDDQDVVLALAPTATLRGILIDEETGNPAVGREIDAFIRIGREGEAFQMGFGHHDKTDEKGCFRGRGNRA